MFSILQLKRAKNGIFCFRNCSVFSSWRGPRMWPSVTGTVKYFTAEEVQECDLLLYGLSSVVQLKRSKSITFCYRDCSLFYSWRNLRMWSFVTGAVLYFRAEEVQERDILLQGLFSILQLKRAKNRIFCNRNCSVFSNWRGPRMRLPFTGTVQYFTTDEV